MILVSACLLGCACRYDGQSKPHPLAMELARQGRAVPVCPEQMGGLTTPRLPSERQGERVVMQDGRDVTEEYRRGAADMGATGHEQDIAKANQVRLLTWAQPEEVLLDAQGKVLDETAVEVRGAGVRQPGGR